MSDDDDDLLAPHRPRIGWTCADCAREWPCPVFRRRVRALYHDEPDRLRAFMNHFRERATAELPTLTAAQLDARFVGWTAEPPRPRFGLRSI